MCACCSQVRYYNALPDTVDGVRQAVASGGVNRHQIPQARHLLTEAAKNNAGKLVDGGAWDGADAGAAAVEVEQREEEDAVGCEVQRGVLLSEKHERSYGVGASGSRGLTSGSMWRRFHAGGSGAGPSLLER